ncbi:MAG: transporter substrate-binding domain-containing protein [Rhodospirillales bacterium]|nr:transporter substrate-binding domain-containing protein [Rhodospirillales bacterium]
MAVPTYRIGILFSRTGPYGAVGRAMLHGALLAVAEVNARGAVSLVPVLRDPGGELAAYRTAAAELLQNGVRQVIGCYTSSSRKEIIPSFEKHDGLLWYPSHYEGFESSENVIYTGAVANQHLLPLVDFLVRTHGNRAFCLGSNYIWAWENNRVFRETIDSRGGAVLAERYFAMGDTDFGPVIRAIFDSQASFVFSTLVGTSAYAFFRAFRAEAIARGIDQPATIPVASCSLSEPELDAIGPAAVDGHLSSSVYFSSLPTDASRRFVADYTARFPDGPAACADAEASYIAVRLLALSLAEAGSADAASVRRAVRNQRIVAPQGEVWVDPDTLHTWLTPRIGRSNRDARFDLLLDAGQPVRPDPYLVWHAARFEARDASQRLRVVR